MLTETQRKLASVQEIAKLSPIQNSDFLEVAEMKNLGWKVVVKKGEFKIGDKVIYFEIDSTFDVKTLPEALKFLAEKGTRKLFTGRTPDTSAFSGEYIRIKTIKLRGQVSQGLIVPALVKHSHNCLHANVGDDLTQLFQVEVWDRLVEWYDERSQLGPRAQCHQAGTFPSDVPKTDEIRIESLMEYFSDPEMTNAVWECTEKNDGSSCTLFYRPLVWPDDPMRIASRRFILKDDGFSDDWFAAFKKIGWDVLEDKLKTVYWCGLLEVDNTDGKAYSLFPREHELAIQGEMIGPKFNGNRDRNKESHFRVFRVFDITEQKFVTPRVRYGICKFLGLDHVKVIETCKIFDKCKNIDDFEQYVTRKSDNGNQIEGVVFKRVDNGEISFKKVSAKYLLGHED